MFELQFRRKHRLGLKKARAAAEQVADELEREFDLVSHWDGQTLSFSRPGAVGSLVVTRDTVEMHARLASRLHAFRSRIELCVRDSLDRYFG